MRTPVNRFVLILLGASLACGPGLEDALDDEASPVLGEETQGLSTTRVYGATADTFLTQATPTTVRGAATTLSAKGGASGQQRSLLRFSVTGIPSGASITHVALDLTVKEASPVTGDVHAVSGGWSESTTWSTRPALGQKLAVLPNPATVGTHRRANVTWFVTGNGTFNFYVLSSVTDGVSFHSSEATSLRPALRVTYETAPRAVNVKKVRPVYIVPSDRTPSPAYAAKIQKAVAHLQVWYAQQLGGGTTFSFAPVVSVTSTHPSSWFNTNPNGGGSFNFWFNMVNDGFALTGGAFNDPENIWIYYVDADQACGQSGGAGTSGVAAMPANDLRGLDGKPPVSICGEAVTSQPVCRWVGGLGHELGHAAGLPHPADCDAGATTCPSGTLMWLGYIPYPATSLLTENRTQLSSSPFFTPQTVPTQLPDCSLLY